MSGTLRITLLVTAFTVLFPLYDFGQQKELFSREEIKVDTVIYTSDANTVTINNVPNLYFYYNNNDEVAEVKLFPKANHSIKGFRLLESADYSLIDSLIFFNNRYYRFKVRFHDLTRSDFLKFTFSYRSDTNTAYYELPLLPCTHTEVNIYPTNNELYIGEEKVFELISDNLENIRYSSEWTTGNDIDYRVTENNGLLYLHLLANKLGKRTLNMQLESNKPFIDTSGYPDYNLPPLIWSFDVKASRLRFLNIDRKDITLDEKSRTEGVEIQMDNSYGLSMNRTYRIENQEAPGGALIAEIFTKNNLANNKVLCILRPYNYHRQSEGYLYIKDCDEAKFITNFSITPKTKIEEISVLHEGGDWMQNLNVHPGETFDLKIKGVGLNKAKFYFEDLSVISSDSTINSESETTFKLKVPMNISKRKINIYNYNEPAGYSLNISEYQRPRDFDYVFINYGDLSRRVSGIRGPVFYDKTIPDVILTFNRKLIDDANTLYGKQYLSIDIKITGKNNELIEMRTIPNIVVCPGDNSPRYRYYDTKDCSNDEFSLNKYISRKTYDMDEWSKIYITIHHQRDKYGGEGSEKEIEIIMKRSYKFDVDVSFPAGLVTISKQDNGQMGFGSLSGISMAMVAQFSFYQPNKIAKYRPYKIGAGFLAFNAFNFTNDNTSRDVGVVALGSLYPTTKDVKLSFPLYVGGGYFLKQGKWFFLIGPGIRVQL